MRKLPAVLTATAVAATLVACSSTGPAAIDGCTPEFAPGSASELVSASGALGTQPEVDFPTPLVSDDVQRSVLVAGDGEPAPHGAQVDFDITILGGADGEVVQASEYSGESHVRRAAQGDIGFAAALACARPGDRIAVTGPVAEVVGAGSYASVGIEDDDTVVAVLDVQTWYPGKADGVNQLPDDGMPSVVTAVDGTPGITLPDATPPGEARDSVIKLGDGPRIEEGDTVVIHYSSWTWPDSGEPSLTESSWTDGAATNLVVSEDATAAPIVDALLDQPIGSQVLLVVPPADGADGPTYVYVIDLLGIAG